MSVQAIRMGEGVKTRHTLFFNVKNDDLSMGESASIIFQILHHVGIASRAGRLSLEAVLTFSKHKIIKETDINDRIELYTIHYFLIYFDLFFMSTPS